MEASYLIYLLIIAAGFTAGLLRFKESVSIRLITAILFISLCTEVASLVLAYTVRNNNIVYHIYHPIHLLLWALFFRVNLRHWAKRTVMPVLIALLIFASVNSLFFQGFDTLPDYFITFECIALLFWSAYLFIQFLDRPGHENIFSNSIFIICIALIWYNMVDFIFFNQYENYSGSTPYSARAVHYFANYTYYTLILIALSIRSKSVSHHGQ